jgi:hypothetical protein
LREKRDGPCREDEREEDAFHFQDVCHIGFSHCIHVAPEWLAWSLLQDRTDHAGANVVLSSSVVES